MVETRPDDNHRPTMGFIGVIGKLAGGTDNMRAGDAGNFSAVPECRLSLHHSWRRSCHRSDRARAIVGHGQVVHGGHRGGGAVSQLQAFNRQFVQQNVFQRDFVEVFRTFAAEVREADVRDLVMATQQAQTQLNLFAGFTVALFEVPFAFVAPAESEEPFGTVRSPFSSKATVFHSGFFS